MIIIIRIIIIIIILIRIIIITDVQLVSPAEVSFIMLSIKADMIIS